MTTSGVFDSLLLCLLLLYFLFYTVTSCPNRTYLVYFLIMNSTFPDNFLWGASTSAHQVEGDNFYNDWWEWEALGFTDPSGKACDHYHRYGEDFLLANQLGHNAHRLGIEWSRVEKHAGVWNEAEWDHYSDVIDELLIHDIEPVVTLNHFTVPAWFSKKGSWTTDESAELFARLCAKAIERLGDRVKWWITINEPNILAILSYFYGQWTPCVKDFDSALLVLKNMLKGHVSAYQKMHEYAEKTSSIRCPEIGLAKAVTAFHPHSPFSIGDRIVTRNRRYFHNHAFVNSALKGKVLIPGLSKESLPMSDTMDFIGLNYYFRQFLRHTNSFEGSIYGEVCPVEEHGAPDGITDMGWEIYPEGLSEVIKEFKCYKKPIIISENGLATTDDEKRTRYIKTHLSSMLNAIHHGAPVIGYLHWSLLDNFEWADGYSKRFGLVSVDFETQERTVTDAALYYESVIRSNSL